MFSYSKSVIFVVQVLYIAVVPPCKGMYELGSIQCVPKLKYMSANEISA